MSNYAITHNVKISVETQYQTEVTDMDNNHFFAYKIQIENLGNATIQLENRHWRIYDGGFLSKKISGEGVVGDKPILDPGESYSYSSWSSIEHPIGRMEGYYSFRNIDSGESIEISIPVFELIAGFLLN